MWMRMRRTSDRDKARRRTNTNVNDDDLVKESKEKNRTPSTGQPVYRKN